MGKAVFKIAFSILVFHQCIAAPSEIKLEDIADVTKAEETTESGPTLLDEPPKDPASPQNPRHKRWYNYYGLPPAFPTYFNRDDPFIAGGIAPSDPLVLIHRRLQEINNSFRQPTPPQFPPGFPQFPPFVPVFYIPQVGCACKPGDTPQRPDRPGPPPDNNRNSTDNPNNPGVENRWPVMEDDRQNWGIVEDDQNTNQSIDGDEGEGDGSRPISFEPIRPIRPINRPAPPVEHGTVDGNASSNTPSSTTTTPRPSQAPGNPGLQAPSNCDSAILRCCHMPQVTYDCFAYQGCPDPTSYGNPCDNGVISRVIDRFLRFYGQRTG